MELYPPTAEVIMGALGVVYGVNVTALLATEYNPL